MNCGVRAGSWKIDKSGIHEEERTEDDGASKDVYAWRFGVKACSFERYKCLSAPNPKNAVCISWDTVGRRAMPRGRRKITRRCSTV